MPNVRRIDEPRDHEVNQLIEDLLGIARGEEGIRSFLFIAETRRANERLAGTAGSYRRDPVRALGELAAFKIRLAHAIKK